MNEPLHESIKTFVQEVLGCACPDQVFDHIAFKRDIIINDTVILNARVNVGNRLLLYIVHADHSFTKQSLADILDRGMEDRDGNGFNRFRLVLTTDIVQLSQHDAEVIFDTFPNKDDTMHLHFVDKKEMPF